MSYCNYNKNNSKHTITKISVKLLDAISATLPDEKPNNTIGYPIIPYRKVMDGIVCVLRIRCQCRMLPKKYNTGSTCHRRFQ